MFPQQYQVSDDFIYISCVKSTHDLIANGTHAKLDLGLPHKQDQVT
jgi:hypothetical protein